MIDAMATDDRKLLVLLSHDVGKYVARIARNVPIGGDVPNALAPLLVKDLYDTHAGRRASARFEELAGTLAARHPSIDVARASLARIDALEAAVRAHEPAALREAAALARAVGDILAKLATRDAS